jgi:hypothetical protein
VQLEQYTTATRPICRCTRCGARWVIARVRQTDEYGEPMYCLACGEEYEVLDGILQRTARPATPAALHEIRRERHALAVAAGTLRRRGGRNV